MGYIAFPHPCIVYGAECTFLICHLAYWIVYRML